MKNKKNIKNDGFTLIETLIAVSIFSVSILSLMAVLSQGISDTNYAKQKIIAAYLAQEGIEYVRNMRDTFVLYGGQTSWNDFNNKLILAACQGQYGCYFDDEKDEDGNNLSVFDPDSNPQPMTKILFESCSSNGCPPLLYDSTTGKYGYDIFGVNSGFVRKIQTSQIGVPPSNETKITSTISWVQGSGDYEITFSENLFNWQ